MTEGKRADAKSLSDFVLPVATISVYNNIPATVRERQLDFKEDPTRDPDASKKYLYFSSTLDKYPGQEGSEAGPLWATFAVLPSLARNRLEYAVLRNSSIQRPLGTEAENPSSRNRYEYRFEVSPGVTWRDFDTSTDKSALLHYQLLWQNASPTQKRDYCAKNGDDGIVFQQNDTSGNPWFTFVCAGPFRTGMNFDGVRVSNNGGESFTRWIKSDEYTALAPIIKERGLLNAISEYTRTIAARELELRFLNRRGVGLDEFKAYPPSGGAFGVDDFNRLVTASMKAPTSLSMTYSRQYPNFGFRQADHMFNVKVNGRVVEHSSDYDNLNNALRNAATLLRQSDLSKNGGGVRAGTPFVNPSGNIEIPFSGSSTTDTSMDLSNAQRIAREAELTGIPRTVSSIIDGGRRSRPSTVSIYAPQYPAGYSPTVPIGRSSSRV